MNENKARNRNTGASGTVIPISQPPLWRARWGWIIPKQNYPLCVAGGRGKCPQVRLRTEDIFTGQALRRKRRFSHRHSKHHPHPTSQPPHSLLLARTTQCARVSARTKPQLPYARSVETYQSPGPLPVCIRPPGVSQCPWRVWPYRTTHKVCSGDACVPSHLR